MGTDHVAAIAAAVPQAPADGPLPPAAAVPASSFGAFVADGLAHADTSLRAGQVELQQLAAGHGGSLTQVMVRLEESRLALQMVVQVRNRLLESYQDVMRMQV